VRRVVERYVGAPAEYEELTHKPGRRLTLRTRGPNGSAIVKLYRSDRAAYIAERISSLTGGPVEPELPQVLTVDTERRMLVVSELAGVPLREAVLADDREECSRAGAAIAEWHRAWEGREPPHLVRHTVEDELAALVDRAALAPREIGTRVAAALPAVRGSWEPVTVVHRDLYEEQVLLGERIGLIDLDEIALGPPELDVGNLMAHLDLLELRSERDLSVGREAFLEGYESVAKLDRELLERCRLLARLRLACIHEEPRLLDGDGDGDGR
jgi:Ser/Thr protein kinase RdoA (MazF antagonist)